MGPHPPLCLQLHRLQTLITMFLLEDLIEVHRDPIGHYHHWSFAIGRLLEGTLEHGQWVRLPGVEMDHYATIGCFEAFRKILPGPTLTADPERVVGVMLRSPAPTKRSLQLDTHSLFNTTKNEVKQQLPHTLKNHPDRFFHDRGPHGRQWRCRECSGILHKHHEQCLPVLKALLQDHNIEESIRQDIQHHLKRYDKL